LCWRKTGSVSAHVFRQNCQRASPAVVSERGVDQCARKEPNGPQKQVACDLRAKKALQLCVIQPPMHPMNPSMAFKMARLGTKWEMLDIFAYKDGDFENPEAIAQCKAWATVKVGVKNIREFYGAMSANGIEKGFYFITGEYTEDAVEFAEKNKIQIFDGEKIVHLITRAPKAVQDYFKKFLEMNNFVYPTCPSCNKKMYLRSSKKNVDERFWGCQNFPICKQTFKVSQYQEKFL